LDCPAADQTPGAAGLRTEAGTLSKVDLGRKEVRYKQKAPSIGRLPLSALEKLDFQLLLL